MNSRVINSNTNVFVHEVNNEGCQNARHASERVANCERNAGKRTGYVIVGDKQATTVGTARECERNRDQAHTE